MDFRVLGLLEVRDGGDPVEVGSAKVRSLLAALLLHHNEVVSADRLADAIWGTKRPPTVANTLQGYVSQLRKALGAEAIETRSPGYRMNVAPEQIDFVRFERLLAEGRAALAAGTPQVAADVLAEALALWRGDALADFAFAAFAQGPTVRLHELRLGAIESQVDAHLALGRHAELVGRLRSLVDAHPLRERLWAQLITALYRSGRQGEALRAFSEVRERLGEELGIEPGAVLKALEEAVLLQATELDWLGAPPRNEPPTQHSNNVPTARSTFIGREQELAELKHALVAGGLVTVVGPGGAGKSRLAREAARQLLSRFPDGIWLAELAPAIEPVDVIEAVATAVGVGVEPETSLVDGLVRALGRSRRLLLLDDCEHVAAPAADLAAGLLAGAPGVTLLATSRQPLRVDGETVWRIGPLSVPPEGAVADGTADRYDAVRLFVERADVAGGFALTPENAPAVAELCRRLDGMPLAIELAASRSRALTPRQLLEHLGDRFALLSGGARCDRRHRSLRTSLEWSHRLLTPRERILFRRLAVFEAVFTLEAAETVCSAEPVQMEEVVEVLARLADASLVSVDRCGEAPKYRLLECHRDYAAEQLEEAGEFDLLQARYQAWQTLAA